jgi:hypothetical protein
MERGELVAGEAAARCLFVAVVEHWTNAWR